MRHIRLQITLSVVVLAFTLATASGQTVLYVDDDAALGGDGLSWPTAYRYLQDALSAAEQDPTVTETRVAGGLYRPDLDEGGQVTLGDRGASFRLRDALAIRGGYRGLAGGGDPDDRDIPAFPTVLSGDLGGNDGPDFANYGENSLHVMSGPGVGPGAVLDGLTVTAGNADYVNSTISSSGGGLLLDEGSPTIQSCIFTGNYARGYVIHSNPTRYYGGGAVYIATGSPTFSGCDFISNIGGNGCAILNRLNSNLTLTGCRFEDMNRPAVFNHLSAAQMTDCQFTRNGGQYGDGGAITNLSADVVIAGCSFIENSTDEGGAIYNVGVLSKPRTQRSMRTLQPRQEGLFTLGTVIRSWITARFDPTLPPRVGPTTAARMAT